MFIEALIVLFALGFSAGITYLIPKGFGYDYFAPFLLLIAGYLIGMGLAWALLYIVSLPYSKKKDYSKPKKLATFWLTEALWYINHHARIKLIIKNNVALPKERYLLVCNHRSKFDPMIIAQLYGKKQLAFISKPTNFKIPLGGKFMKASCYLSIDRYDKLKSLEVMKQASDYIANDLTSIGVFPEGTRSETNELQAFHEGVFSIALKTNCPIVITSIKGTENIHKNFPKRKTVVEFEILEILYPEDYKGMIAKEVSDHAYQLIYNSLQEQSN